MNRRSLIAVLACLSVALWGQSPMKGKAFVIRATADLYTLKDGAMTWVEALSQGDVMDLSKGTDKGKFKGTEYVLAKVKLESGKEGYVIDSLVAREAIMGAVTSDLATLYSQPRDASILSSILPVGNLVALWPVDGKPDFYMVSAFDSATGTFYKEKYILAADVTANQADVNVILLLKAAAKMPKKEQKQKILKTIETKYPATAFASLVDAFRNEIAGNDAAAPAAPTTAPQAAATAAVATVGTFGTYSATKPLNVRAKPSVDGAVVLVMKEGDKCVVSERTVEKYAVNDQSDYWYKISSPVEGWVFGAFIKE